MKNHCSTSSNLKVNEESNAGVFGAWIFIIWRKWPYKEFNVNALIAKKRGDKLDKCCILIVGGQWWEDPINK